MRHRWHTSHTQSALAFMRPSPNSWCSPGLGFWRVGMTTGLAQWTFVIFWPRNKFHSLVFSLSSSSSRSDQFLPFPPSLLPDFVISSQCIAVCFLSEMLNDQGSGPPDLDFAILHTFLNSFLPTWLRRRLCKNRRELSMVELNSGPLTTTLDPRVDSTALQPAQRRQRQRQLIVLL